MGPLTYRVCYATVQKLKITVFSDILTTNLQFKVDSWTKNFIIKCCQKLNLIFANRKSNLLCKNAYLNHVCFVKRTIK